MDRIAVISSSLSEVGYDPSEQRLEIRFRSGGTYEYYNVPEEVYTDLVEDDSVGKYFHAEIKDQYQFKKL